MWKAARTSSPSLFPGQNRVDHRLLVIEAELLDDLVRGFDILPAGDVGLLFFQLLALLLTRGSSGNTGLWYNPNIGNEKSEF